MENTNNNINRFEEEVMLMLDANTRARANSFINKGAIWVLSDEGICLIDKDILILKVSESYYNSHSVNVF